MIKKYYYVGVIGRENKDDEIKYVYEIDYDSKIAKWATYSWLHENNKKPILFNTKSSAETMVQCLTMNFNFAVLITSYIKFR